MNSDALKTLIKARLRARIERENAQAQLLEATDDFAETIRSKLTGLLETNQFFNFSRCGKDEIYKTCQGCGKWDTFQFRCNLKWCPRCQQRLGLIRRNLISLWAKRIKQPKHLVLTQKNFPTLTKSRIKEHTKRLAKMRRSKCFAEVSGGCCSTEITNENRGWHLHAHLLLDVRWLDMEQVSIRWGKLVGQNFAIVKIMDVREKQYLQEICKYVVEGSELAKWEPDQINEFVQGVRGLRMFNSFGSLRQLAPEIRRELAAAKPPAAVCQCGCDQFTYEDEATMTAHAAEKLFEQTARTRKHQMPAPASKPAADANAGTPSML